MWYTIRNQKIKSVAMWNPVFVQGLVSAGKKKAIRAYDDRIGYRPLGTVEEAPACAYTSEDNA
jgi:hypothetical protein